MSYALPLPMLHLKSLLHGPAAAAVLGRLRVLLLRGGILPSEDIVRVP